MASNDLINLGVAPDSGTGDSARRGGAKINQLFTDIYTHLGDNPVGNDPTGPNYGYRQEFGEYEFKVGEIHAAGRFVPIQFKTTNTTPTVNGFDQTTGGIPDVYQDSEWFFLARGDSLGLDLRKIDSDGAVHIVLPLALPGDTIRIRDTFNTWGNRFINVWTTPYEFQTTTQVTEWMGKTKQSTAPGSGALTVGANNRILKAVPYKTSTDATGSHTELNQPFIIAIDSDFPDYIVPANSSPIHFRYRSLNEINFIFVGYDTGWVCQSSSMNTYDVDKEIDNLIIKMNQVDSDLALARKDLDSDSLHIQMIRTEADSDAAVIAQLRRDADSDSLVIQQLSIIIDGGTYGP